jgi:anti-anti-sigma factor
MKAMILNNSTLSVSRKDDHIVASFHHNLDMEMLLRLKPEMERILPKIDTTLLIDLKRVDFLDSSAVGVIALFFRHTQTQKLDMAIVHANPQPEAVLAMVGLTDYVSLYPDVKTALNSLA